MFHKTGTTAYNRPHQPMIHYSAKGYDEYRAGLIKRLKDKGFLLKDDDFINAFIDLTAYLGEVLMTYQNAYAQEIYLETAQLRESLFSLAFMVDYRVDPGAAAFGNLVVAAKPDKKGLLPERSLVSGKDEGAKEQVFFETDTDLFVDSHFNDLCLAEGERFNEIIVGSRSSMIVNEKLVVNTGRYLCFQQQIRDATAYFFVQIQSAAIDEEKNITTLSWETSAAFEHKPFTEELKTSLGSWMIINNEQKGLSRLDGTTLWLDGKYENISKGGTLILKKRDADSSCISYGIIEEVTFELANIKTGILRWISDTPGSPPEERERYQYTIEVKEGDKTFYALEKDLTEVREITRLTMCWLKHSSGDYTPEVMVKSQDHIVYAGIHRTLNVQEKEENKATINGERSLILDGDLSKLEKYRPLLLHEVIDGVRIVEEVRVSEVNLDTSGNTPKSTLRLRNAIRNGFTRHGVRIWGNVVKVTQGKTAANRILGNGRGEEAYQTFYLPQSPLTYERHGREGIKGAIDVMVSDLPWEQMDDLLSSDPEDRHFVIETDFEGKSRVIFGDGLNGSKPHTGRDNIIATFRTGQGKAGNVAEGVLKRPVSKPPFLDEVFNPERTGGGSDPDTEGQLREKLPAEHLTFDRAVSLRDYTDLALAYPGIGKAKAGWCWRRNKQYVVLAVAGEEGEALSASLLQDLRDYIDARRDINQPLQVREVERTGIRLTISVTLSSGYDKERVRDVIEKALGTGMNEDGTPQFFHFDRLGIGMSIHRKDIYHVVENIPGVGLITRLLLERTTPPAASGIFMPTFCPDDIWINNWELAGLDVLDLEVTLPPVNKICPRIRG